MPYTITLSDNTTSLITIPDRVVLGPLESGAPSNCSLNLIGRGAVNIGTAINTNFVWMLQNFANNAAPVSPLSGQLWYNTTAPSPSLQLYNTSSQWVQVLTSDAPMTLNQDVYVYDNFGDSSRLGANGIITLIRADYQPRIVFEGTAHAGNAATLQLGVDGLGNVGLTFSTPGLHSGANSAIWHAGNLTPFDLNANNTTANAINNFWGQLLLNGNSVATLNNLYSTSTGFLPLTGGTMLGIINSTIAGIQSLTPVNGDHSNAVATTAFVHNVVSNSVGSYLPLTGGTMTGVITATAAGMTSLTPASGDNTSNVATTAFVHGALSSAAYLPISGGTMTGLITATSAGLLSLTPTSSDSSTKVATTAFVHNVVSSFLPLSGGVMSGQINATAAGMLSLTPGTGDNSTKVATTAFVDTAVAAAVATLDSAIAGISLTPTIPTYGGIGSYTFAWGSDGSGDLVYVTPGTTINAAYLAYATGDGSGGWTYPVIGGLSGTWRALSGQFDVSNDSCFQLFARIA